MLFNLIPAQYKVLVGFILFCAYTVSVALWSSHIASKIVHAEWDAEKIEVMKQTEKERSAIEAKYNDASAKLEEAKNAKDVVYKTITKQVDKIVDRVVYRNIALDDDGLLLINAAIAGRPIDTLKFETTLSSINASRGQDGR